MAQLEHMNIIRYFVAWVEPTLEGAGDETKDEAESVSRQLSTSDQAESVLPQSSTSDQAESVSRQSSTSDQSDSLKVLPCIYIAMECCQRNSENYIEEAEDKVSWKIFQQLVEGLAHVHKSGYVHRDLCPKKIFLTADNTVKIADFGLAIQMGQEDSGYSGKVGMAYYQAPEMGEERVDDKADIFSLGIIFFELFYHFETGAERAEVLPKLKLGNLPPTWTRDESFTTFLMLMLAADPSTRPSAEDVLAFVHHGDLNK